MPSLRAENDADFRAFEAMLALYLCSEHRQAYQG